MIARTLRRSLPLFLALGIALVADRADAQATAQAFIEQRQAEAAQILRRPAGDARDREVARLIDGMLDYPELARRALGRHWSERSEAEREQFRTLLQQLVERSYQDNLQRTVQFDVRVVGTEAEGDATRVRTEARSRSNRRAPPVQIDYSLRQIGSTWRVFDIHTDGVSLVANYRSQFNRIITRDGWAALITRMQERIAGGSGSL